ncbi:MAG: hypothetical protein EA406_12040 [Rhodospirillales bacterium]|nr:MAG: hypothetical protein EA406_12040 [Rhodospirillales bacterium]
MGAMLEAAAIAAHAEPFAIADGPDAGDLDDGRRATLAAVLGTIAEGGGHIVVTAPSGVGTTGFLRLVVAMTRSAGRSPRAADPPLFECRTGMPGGAFEAWYAPVLAAPGPRLLVLDNADQLDPALAHRLCQAIETSAGGASTTAVVRAVTRKLKSRLAQNGADDDGFPPAALAVELAAMTAPDVDALIRRRLAASGYHGPPPFSEAAIDRIVYFAKGNPERVLRLCHRSFDLALQESGFPITPALVKDAAYALFLPGHLQKLARGLAGKGQPSADTADAADSPSFAAVPELPEQAPSPRSATAQPAPPPPEGRPPATTADSGAMDRSPPDSAFADGDTGGETGGRSIRSVRLGPRPLLRLSVARAAHTFSGRATLRPGRRWLAAAAGVAAVIAAIVIFGDRTPTPPRGSDAVTAPLTPPAETERAVAVAVAPALPTEPAEPAEMAAGVETTADDDPGTAEQSAAAGLPSEPAPPADAGIPAQLQRALADTPDAPRTRIDGIRAPAVAPDASAVAGRTAGTDDPAEPTAAEASADPAAGPSAPMPRTPPASSPLVADAQSLLAELGYGPGPVDGMVGPRTRAAVRAFQRAEGESVDGRITPALVATLRARQAAGAAVTPEERGRSLWSALGFDLDSVRAPGRFLEYCRNNPDTWVYDHGERRFVYCERVISRP